MFQCRRSKCEKEYTLASNRNRHELVCKNGELPEVAVKSLRCNNLWCGKTFSCKFNLERHLIRCKQKVKKIFPCPTCSKEFTKVSRMKRHKLCHVIKPMYCCDDCSNVYVRRDKYELHKNDCQGAVTLYSPFTMVDVPQVAEVVSPAYYG